MPSQFISKSTKTNKNQNYKGKSTKRTCYDLPIEGNRTYVMFNMVDSPAQPPRPQFIILLPCTRFRLISNLRVYLMISYISFPKLLETIASIKRRRDSSTLNVDVFTNSPRLSELKIGSRLKSLFFIGSDNKKYQISISVVEKLKNVPSFPSKTEPGGSPYKFKVMFFNSQWLSMIKMNDKTLQ